MKKFLIAAAAGSLVAGPLATAAHADEAQILERLETMQKQLETQQKQMDAQKREIERLRAALAKKKPAQVEAATAPAAQTDIATKAEVETLRVQLAGQESKAKQAAQEQPVWSIANLRPTLQSPDGRFSISMRGRFQFDMANYFQDDPGALNVDFRRGSVGTGREVTSARELSDGANFRRAQIGLEGKFWHDFNFRFVYEFGGSGSEGPARINDAFINYAGFAPFTFQVGAFTPNANLDDSTASDETLFIERASPAELSRALAGSDGRYAAGVRGSGERWFASLFWSGGTTVDAETAGEQSALVGRAGGLIATGSDFNVYGGANTSYVFEAADQGSTATGARYPIRFRDRPELRVDSTRLIDTGSIDANGAYASGIEAAANWKNFFFQGEYLWYGIDRRLNPIAENPKFSGWYAEASWVLTGETHRYSSASASFGGPKPAAPVGTDDGLGAIELAGRFSHVDLNFREGALGAATPLGGIRGGEQDVWTLGVNWYLNANLRASLNYFMVDVDRLNPGNNAFGPAPATPPDGVQIGQDYEAIALRTQFTF